MPTRYFGTSLSRFPGECETQIHTPQAPFTANPPPPPPHPRPMHRPPLISPSLERTWAWQVIFADMQTASRQPILSWVRTFRKTH
jgi:hypothetical protein